MELQPHQQRVVTEKTELDEKLQKLKVFFKSDTYNTLAHEERSLLQSQMWVMASYSDILRQRIAAFGVSA